ncbi:syntaxin 6, N-terminal-domain-containing protein [Fimicolochytrium jonesii]|uniref:syntaxin 6, N-terminal-domain-containing protein n=1 Tax=Fimicolochytrium jonesii TaxID=1396493 RepID=UPI0022FDEC3B|nr:syntaxin 6, N-terminal-domain-containing protein [Fimicolochytrium jonesii]KAI8822904.1 syntaxin 6, N-terminal-domain-containing protein [Fimicolochytrium jonesii]
MAEDPYFALKDEVELNVSNTSRLYQQWNDSLKGPDTSAASESFRRESEALKEALLDIDEDLKALQETIGIVEANPAKFRLDVREIDQRKNFIARTRATLQEMRAAVQSPQKRVEKENRDALLGTKTSRKTDPYGRTQEDYQSSNQRFIEREAQQQQLLFREQDEQLDGVLNTVGNLKEIANVMGQELDDQTGLLVDLEANVDTTAGKLQLGMKRMNKFIKDNSDTKQQWTIICLIVVLIILILMIIWL